MRVRALLQEYQKFRTLKTPTAIIKTLFLFLLGRKRRNESVGIALKPIDILPCWCALCYGFSPTMNQALPPNSPTIHVTDLLNFKGVSPLQKESLRRCGSPLCYDLFEWDSEP